MLKLVPVCSPRFHQPISEPERLQKNAAMRLKSFGLPTLKSKRSPLDYDLNIGIKI